MPVNAVIVPILEKAKLTGQASAAALKQLPVGLGERGLGTERTSAGKRAILQVSRDVDNSSAVSGTVAVYGMDLPHPLNGVPLGNVFAHAATATSVRPQADIIPADGTLVTFATNIDLASGNLTAAINGVTDAIVVSLPKIRLAVNSTLALMTATMTSAGVVTTSGSYDTALSGGILAVGDTVELGGKPFVVSVLTNGTTFTLTNPDGTVPGTAISSASPLYLTTPRRRFLQVVSGSVAASDQVQATVVNSRLNLTFATGSPPASIGLVSGYMTGIPVDLPAVYLGTPSQILADGANTFTRVGIRSRTVAWAILTAPAAGGVVSATRVYVEHASE